MGRLWNLQRTCDFSFIIQEDAYQCRKHGYLISAGLNVPRVHGLMIWQEYYDPWEEDDA